MQPCAPSALAPRAARPTPRRPRSVRPAFDVLEDRTVPSGLEVVPADPNDWPMYNHDPAGSRHNHAEQRLSPSTVGELGVRWSYPTAGPIAGTPAVVNDRVYVADATGVMYALDRDGNLLWQTTLQVGPTVGNSKVTASALVTNRTVIIGDLSGQIHGLDVDTGAVKWTTNPNPHPFAAIWGSATMVGNYVAIGTSSNEWIIPAVVPGYVPTFRGSLVLLDPSTGNVVWQTFTISEAEHAAGASGATIWGSPTYDPATNTIYATTGQNYSQPTTGLSDAFVAFDAATGAIKWFNQQTEGDEWTLAFGDSSLEHPDYDIADSPQIYKIGGRTVLSAGQKSGFFHVLDAATGEQINDPIQLAPPGTAGGLFADSAYANGVVYANGTDWPEPFFGPPPNKGILSAVAADGSGELWRFETPFSPNVSGVAVANGVVYLQSSFNATLFALDAASGDVLAQVVTGGVASGPAISRGQIYLGAGDATFNSLDPSIPLGSGAIIALGLPSRGGDPAPSTGPTLKGPIEGGLQLDPATGLATFQGSGHLTLMGEVAVHAEFLFGPGDLPGSLAGTGVAVFTAANGHVLVANVLWSIDPDGQGRLEFRWPDEITLGDGTTVKSTGRFVELPFGGLRATSSETGLLDGGKRILLELTGEIVDPDPLD